MTFSAKKPGIKDKGLEKKIKILNFFYYMLYIIVSKVEGVFFLFLAHAGSSHPAGQI